MNASLHALSGSPLRCPAHRPSSLEQKAGRFTTAEKQLGKWSVLLLLFLFPFSLSAQAQPALEWNKTLGGNLREYLYAVKQTADGGYIAAGVSNSAVGGDKSQAGNGNNDYWVIKVAPDGTRQWDKMYGGKGTDELKEVFQTADGGYLLAGNSTSDAGNDKSQNDKAASGGIRGDYWIVKIDAAGEREWDKTIGGTREEILTDAKQTPDGGYILIGTSNSAVSGDKTKAGTESWIVKLRADGSIQWDNPIEYIHKSNIDPTQDGGYIVGGNTTNVPAQDYTDSYIIKLSPNGRIEWSTVFNLHQSELMDVHQTREGQYIVAVKTETPGSGIPYLVIKLGNTGIELWRKVFTTSTANDDFKLALIRQVIQTADGGFLAGGYSDSPAGADKSEDSKGGDDYWLVKMDADGNKQWDKTIGGPGQDFLQTMELTRDGGYILGGNSDSPTGQDKTEASRGEADFWIVKLAPEFNNKLLSFSANNLGFTVTADSSVPAQSVLLVASSGTPQVTLSKSASSSWLTLPSPALGTLSFNVNAAGLAPGTYNATVNAIAPGYAGATLNVLLTVVPGNQLTTVRINAGGPAFTTSDGRVFSEDRYFGGTDRIYYIPDREILYTTDDALYRTERSAPSFSYNIPVVNGDYVVVLHFAEIWFDSPKGNAGKRLFNVDMEGSRKLENYDIYAQADDALAAVEEEFQLKVTDGVLNIDFSKGAANLPTVAAIEVIPKSDFTRTTLTLPAVADAYVHTYFPDENFGTADQLIVKSGEINISRQTYLKFPLTGISEVTSARLRIYGSNVESTMKVNTSAYSVDNDAWTETAITYNNAPASSTWPLARTTVKNVPGYRVLDVTAFVQSQAEGDKVVSIMLKNPTSVNKKLIFHSKENPSGMAPELVVTTRKPVDNSFRMSAGPGLKEEPDNQKSNASTLFPNPVKKQFTLGLSSRHEGAVSLQLITRSGKLYDVKATEQSTASARKQVDLSGLSLARGMYLLKIRSGTATEVLKVLVAE
ncbi:CBM96 family carbohydrate-binding protein [Dyadobacter sediminis]|nr:malectin domain-containing carbohydrate-binding protein [Dyadobacter sediminis]